MVSETEQRTGVLTRLLARKRLTPAEKERLASGGVRLGRYVVTGRLGHGGMGAVLAARDESLDRQVALKVLTRDSKEEFRVRFQREAQALARLDHPNVVRVHAHEKEGDLDYLVLERVQGRSLEAHLNKAGTLAEDEVWRLLRHTVRAMAAAEAQGILHRDLKPGNILWVPASCSYKICDFGLARFQTGEGSALTMEGQTMGTPFYMSPEQVRGDELDPRTDMYSLGMTLHEVLTGEVPFEGGPIGGVLVRRLEREVPSLGETCPAASEALVAIVDTLCARDRARRFPSWAELEKKLGEGGPLGVGSGVHALSPDETKDYAQVLGPEGELDEDLEVLEDESETRREPAIGETLGSYTLIQVLGRGGMGVIYEAKHTQSDEQYAVKALIVGEGADGERRRKRFQTEVDALRRLHHKNVVRVHDSGTKGPFDWYSMDLVDGRELTHLLEEKALTLREKLNVFVQICKAIEHAHERNVVHRDLKPANVLVDAEKRAFVLDFGLAKIAEEGKMGLTRTGAFLGTPYYMAPEQFLDPKGVDKRTDVFALGVMLYELMTGERPFAGDTAGEVSYKIMRESPPRPTKVNPNLRPSFDAICLKALERAPERRYPSVKALKKDVIRYRRGTAVAETLGDRIKSWLRRWYRKNKVGFVTGVLVASLIYVPIVVVLYWLLP